MFQLSRLTLVVGFWDFWWPLVVQGASLGLVFVPLTTATNDPVPLDRMGNATSIFNLMRNIGASIGISIVETVQYRKQQMHTSILGAHIDAANPITQRAFQGLRAYFLSRGSDPASATHQANAALFAMVERQAAMLSYNDVFLFLAIMFMLMIPFLFWMTKPKKRGRPAMAH